MKKYVIVKKSYAEKLKKFISKRKDEKIRPGRFIGLMQEDRKVEYITALALNIKSLLEIMFSSTKVFSSTIFSFFKRFYLCYFFISSSSMALLLVISSISVVMFSIYFSLATFTWSISLFCFFIRTIYCYKLKISWSF